MDDTERQRIPQEFISELELNPSQYELEDRKGGYTLFVRSDSKRQLRFGYVRLNVSGNDTGKLIVYAIGDISDPEGRFTAQPKNPKDALYKFWPDDKEARRYAAKVLMSAYQDRF